MQLLTLALLSSLTIAGPLADAGYTSDKYTLSWSKISTQSAVKPAVKTPVEKFDVLAECNCDLTGDGTCDANCCCDPDCPEGAKDDVFSKCDAEGKTAQSVQMCMPKSDFARINVAEVQKWGWSPLAFEQSFCVAKDNNPSKGSFVDPYPIEDVDSAVMAEAFKKARNDTFQMGVKPLPYSKKDGKLKVGAPLVAVKEDTNLATNAEEPMRGMGALPLPRAAAVSGLCDGSNPVRYLVNEAHECVAEPDADASGCDALSPLAFVSKVYVSPDARVGYAKLKESGDLKLLAMAAGEAAPAGASFSSCSCVGALESLEYRIQTDDSGTVIGVKAHVTTTNATCTGGKFSVKQSFSVRYYRDEAFADEGPLLKSGNPGYSDGLPLLAGRETVDPSTDSDASADEKKKAMEVDRRGFGLPASPLPGGCCPGKYAANCPTAPSGTTENSAATPDVATFNDDTATGCSVWLSKDELKEMCQKQDATVHSALSVSATHVGRWGNADYRKTPDWVEIDADTTSPSMSWDDDRWACSGVVGSVDIEVLVAKYGARVNAHRAVVAAKTARGTTTWTHSRPWTEKGTDGRQAFHLRSTVSYETLPEGKLETKIPPMRTVPPLPDDLFYPFNNPYQEGDGSAAASAAPAAVRGSAAAAVIVAATIMMAAQLVV